MATNFLLNEDDGQYYAGQQYFTGQAAFSAGATKTFALTTFNTTLVSAYNSSALQIGSASNFEVYFREGTNAYKKLKETQLSISTTGQIVFDPIWTDTEKSLDMSLSSTFTKIFCTELQEYGVVKPDPVFIATLFANVTNIIHLPLLLFANPYYLNN